MLAGRFVQALPGHRRPPAQQSLVQQFPVPKPVAVRLQGDWQALVWGMVLLVLAPLRWLARALAPAAWPQTDCAASQSRLWPGRRAQRLQWGRAWLAGASRARALVPGHQRLRAGGRAFS